MHAAIKKTFIFLWYSVACLIILVAIIGVSLRSLTPVLNKHKNYIEQYASARLHVDVHINSIQADWARFGPELRFHGVTLSQQHHVIVKANNVTAHVGIFKTLWRRTIFFRSLELSGSDFSIKKTAPQQYLVNEIFLIDSANQTTSLGKDVFEWFILQNHISLKNIHVRLQLDQGDITAQLDKVNIYQSAKGLTSVLEGSISGKMTQLNQPVKKLDMQIFLSAWIGISQNKITFAEMEMLNRNLLIQDGKTNYYYPSLEGIFLWQPVGDNWLLQAKDVTLNKAANKTSNISFELWRLPGHYAAHINEIDLADITLFSKFLNLIPDEINLKAANIQGSLKDMDVIIPEEFSMINQYQFSGVFQDVSSAAYKELPEVRHLSGALSGSVAKGSFILFDNNDDIYFANYFNKPVTEKTLTASGRWNFSKEKLSLLFDSMHLVSPTIEASGQMALDIPFAASSSSALSLLVQYNLKQSQAAPGILPMKLFSADFSQWLASAIGLGLGSEGKVLIRGTLDDFPFLKHEGVFIVDGSIKPMAVSFSPDWPTIKNVIGKLFLHNQTFTADIVTQSQGLTLTQATVSTADYYSDNAVVDINLQAKGAIGNYLKFIQLTPLKTTLGQALNLFTLQGRGNLSLHLALPVHHLDANHIKVQGQWSTQNAQFFWKALNVGLKNIRGVIHFTQDSVAAHYLDATLENEPLHISISSEKEKGVLSVLNFDAYGALSVNQLKAMSKIDWLSLYLAGNTRYHAHLLVPLMATPTYLFSFDTNAQGMKINLPGLLGKTAKSVSSISFNVSVTPSADLAQLILNYQKNITANIDIQHFSQEKNTQRAIQVNAHALQLTWPANIVLPKNSTTDSSSLWQSITAINLNIDHLSLYKNNFSNLALSETRQSGGSVWNVKADEAQGNVYFPVDTKQPVIAKFDYLTLKTVGKKQQKTSTSTTNTDDFSAQRASALPSFYIDIQNLMLGKQKLGVVALHTSSMSHGVKFNDIHINNNLYHFSATGQWINNGENDVTSLTGLFTTDNLGKFLSESGVTKNFQAKASKIDFNIHWLGSPMNFQLKTLEGDTSLDVKDGVIPVEGDAAKMGLGKILSLFSVQSIQRRLQLNFSDLGTNGYSFNTLISRLHFQKGNANVENGAFDGPAAKIGFTGRIGLVQQDYDLYLVVTPYVTSTLPLIATLAGGPIAGVATYAFDKIAAKSIDKLTSYKYLLLGSWSKPKLISLDLETPKKPEEKNIAPVEEATA